MRTSQTSLAGSLALLVLTTTALAGCSGTKPSTDPRTALSAAKSQIDTTSGLHFVLTADPLPSSGGSLERAEGDAKPPSSFAGTAKIHTGSLTATIKVISVGGVVYTQKLFGTGYSQVDPSSLGLPDPGALLDPTRGISTFLTVDASARAQGTARVDGEVLERYRAVLPDIAVLGTDATKVPAVFYLVPTTHELRQLVVTGPFFDASTKTTITLTLTDYGKRLDIRAP